MSMKNLTESQVIQLLKDGQGDMTQAAYAKEIGVSAQFLGDVYRGRRAPGPRVLDYLGLEKSFAKK